MRLDDPARGEAREKELTPEMSWPRDIKRLPEALRITWTDGVESLYPYPHLRGLCRCAGCTGGH